MRITHLFLFMWLALGSVLNAYAEDPSANPPVEHPPVASTITNPAPAVAKQVSPHSTSLIATGKKKRKRSQKIKKEPSLETPLVTEVTIPMAKGELQAEVAARQAQRDREHAPRSSVELSVSTWKPKRATTTSRIPGTSNFEAKGIPYLEADLLAPLFRRHDLQLEGGLGFLAMHRKATIVSTGISLPQDENGYVLSFRVGVIYSPIQFLQSRLAPFVEAALLPSMLVTRESSFDSGQSDTGFPIELGAGVAGFFSKSWGVDIRLTEVIGKVQQSEFTNFALRAGVRFVL